MSQSSARDQDSSVLPRTSGELRGGRAASAFGAGSTRTSQYLDSQSVIVRRMLHPIWVCIDKLTRLVRELSIKRGRTEVSASFNLAAPVPSAGTLKTLKI